MTQTKTQENNLAILNYLLNTFGLASYSHLPNSDEKSCSHFSFKWGAENREIQLLILNSQLIHLNDQSNLNSQNKFDIHFNRPYYFLSFKLNEASNYETITAQVTEGLKLAKELKAKLLHNVQNNLDSLYLDLKCKKIKIDKVFNGDTSDASVYELKQRLQYLEEFLKYSFSAACDKWNIPTDLVLPNDLILKMHQDLLKFDSNGADKMFKSWYEKFAFENRYPR